MASAPAPMPHLRSNSAPAFIDSLPHPKDTYTFLNFMSDVAERTHLVYQTFLNSAFLRSTRTLIDEIAPKIGNSIIWLEKPASCLQAFAIAGAIASGIKLYKYKKHLEKSSGKSLTQTIFKILYTVGKLTEHGVKLTLMIKSFHWTASLADRGFKITAAALKTIDAWSGTLGGVVWVLTLPKLLVGTRKILHGEKFVKGFDTWLSQNIKNTEEGERTPEEQFKLIKAAVSKHEVKNKIRTFLRIQDQRFDKWIDKVQFESLPGDTPQEKIDDLVLSIKKRVISTTHHRKLEFMADLTNLLATAILFAAVLPPLGYVMLGAYGACSMSLYTYQKLTQFQFEHDIGLCKPISEDATPAERTRYIAKWLLQSSS